ncbi:MAG: 30S ribosomal protein S12 methylthiotransferase RimO [Acidimicrobiales bacterium]
MPRSYWVETLGCPKNQVDSDKLEGTLVADGLALAAEPESADVIVINTCAFIEAARQESIDTILAFDARRQAGSRLVVTGCLAERYQQELVDALPEVDLVAPFGTALLEQADDGNRSVPMSVPVSIGAGPRARTATGALPAPSFDLLNLPRPPARGPWAYVKVAEGCDRNCGFCAIPSFRGKQRSRPVADVLAEIDGLGVKEVVLVAQDLASYGRDQGQGQRSLVPLLSQLVGRVDWVRLLYLYPSDLTNELIDAICATGVPYFDLSLQHVSAPLLRRMRRWGDGDRFLRRIGDIRARQPDAAFRTNFIVGYPGETEDHHDELLRFIEAAQLDWCGFFAYSPEEGTYATSLDGDVPSGLVAQRLYELRQLQDDITAAKRDELIGSELKVLVERTGVARSFREAPEIDGIIEVPDTLAVGRFATVEVVDAQGTDLVARPVAQ